MLFLGIFGLIAVIGSNGVSKYAEQAISRDMMTNAEVFDEILASRGRQMRGSAEVLSADFGFRKSIALGDSATVESALDSLKARASVQYAFVIGLDGRVMGDVSTLKPAELDSVRTALDNGKTEGIVEIDGKLSSAVAAPIETPDLAGWLVIAQPLDAATMKRLAQLAPIKLAAEVQTANQLPAIIGDATRAKGTPTEIAMGDERILYSVSELEPLGERLQPRLVLRHSLTAALSKYREIFWLLVVLTAIGLVAIIILGWVIARGVTLPISKLDDAARRVSSGERAYVQIETQDEVGRLAQSFNYMVEAIEEREREISHIALHDILTGLPNRKLFAEQLDFALARLDANRQLVVGYLDLDNFKLVNDTLGHPIGDGLLKQVTARLTETLPDAILARQSGDEFAIMVNGVGHQSDFVDVAEKLFHAFDEPFEIDGISVPCHASIGFSVAPSDGNVVETLLKNADLALYRAKQEGKCCYQFFEPAMDEQARNRRQTEVDLRQGIKHGHFELYYQPLYSLEKERLTGFEALLRWNHPIRGMICPIDFISIAEATNLIIPIGEWVIREACRQAANWPDDVRIAVNISPMQFRSANLSNVIIQALASSGIAPDRLELEITESIFIDNIEHTLGALHSLRNMGVRIALDDFGTGYSSLSYLRSFPFDKIKIDRSFVTDLNTGTGASAIIRAITTLADALGMETIAEGVELQEQADALRLEGCQQIQGYWFSKPITSAAALSLLDSLDQQLIRKIA